MSIESLLSQIELVAPLKWEDSGTAQKQFVEQANKFEQGGGIQAFSASLLAALYLAAESPMVWDYIRAEVGSIVTDTVTKLNPPKPEPPKVRPTHVECKKCNGRGIKPGNDFPSGDAKLLDALKCLSCKGDGQFKLSDTRCDIKSCNNGILLGGGDCLLCLGSGFMPEMKGRRT